MGTSPKADPEKPKKKALEDAALGLIQGQLKQAAMEGLKFVAGMAYEGNRALCDDPNTRFIEKTFCMVVKGLSGAGGGDSPLKQNLDKIMTTLKEVDAKVTQISANVKLILQEMDLLHLEIAEALVGAEAYKALGSIHEEYDRFIKSLENLKDRSDQALAYYAEVITDTRLQRKLDTIFSALTKEIATKEPLLGNIIRQIEVKGANESLWVCYRMYEEYVNSILLDLRKGNTVVSSALLYFETLRQNGKLPGDILTRLANLAINNQIWQKHWDEQIDTLLDHFNTHWDRFAITRSATISTNPADGQKLTAAPAQGINPFFFPEDARDTFRAADAFCSMQQETYGLRGRIFSMGGLFNGALTFQGGSTAAAKKTATLTISRKLDYWSASQPGIYDKVEFSNQWTVHRYHIADVAASTRNLETALPYTPPPIEVTKCDRQTLQPSASTEAVTFGSFVEIARAGGAFAFLSGKWNKGSEDKDPSNATPPEVVNKVEDLREVVEFKIRSGQRALGKIGRPEVGLAKTGGLHWKLGSHSLQGTYRTWLETDKTIEFPAISTDEHIALIWSIDPSRRQTSALITAAQLNTILSGHNLRPTKPKKKFSDDDVQMEPFLIAVNYDSSLNPFPDQGCRLQAGLRLYPVWQDQRPNQSWDYPALRNTAMAGARTAGVFREAEMKERTVEQRLTDVYTKRKLRFRFEASYDIRVETSGVDETPFALYTRAELKNVHLELRSGSVGTELSPGEVTLASLLKRPDGRCFAFDYDHSGLMDHIAFYDVGYLMIYGQVGSSRFQRRPLTWGPGRDWELKDRADRVFAFDFDCSGKLDHFVFYRPGAGKISIMRNNQGVLETVWASNTGLPKLDLMNAADRGLAFDLWGTGRLDHLVFYRPGWMCVWGRPPFVDPRSDRLMPLYFSKKFGNYYLEVPAGEMFAFDYDGSGRMDHLVLYRPGTGRVVIAKKSPADIVSFDAVFNSGNQGNRGIGGYDVASGGDLGLAFDCDGSGRTDHLVFYRPSRGAIYVFKSNDNKSFNPPIHKRNEGDPGRGIADYDLKSPADRMIAFDYNGTGQLDHLFIYRPGTGQLSVVKKKGGADSKEFVKVL